MNGKHGDAWTELSESLAASVEELVIARVEASLERFMRGQVKLLFTEREAAKVLGVGKEKLQAWRRRHLISASRYPKGSLRPGEKDELGGDYFYDIASLLSFHQRYLEQAVSPDTFRITTEVQPLGAEVQQIRKAA
jgi:hypothetical protein